MQSGGLHNPHVGRTAGGAPRAHNARWEDDGARAEEGLRKREAHMAPRGARTVWFLFGFPARLSRSDDDNERAMPSLKTTTMTTTATRCARSIPTGTTTMSIRPIHLGRIWSPTLESQNLSERRPGPTRPTHVGPGRTDRAGPVSSETPISQKTRSVLWRFGAERRSAESCASGARAHPRGRQPSTNTNTATSTFARRGGGQVTLLRVYYDSYYCYYYCYPY